MKISTGVVVGPVLSVQGLSRWAVIGDVTNRNKPAFRVAERLKQSGRDVYLVTPYTRADISESGDILYRQLSDIPVQVKIDAVNLIISPRAGVKALEQMKERGIRFCFMQPGADTSDVVDKAKELGITFQRGCVLVEELPSLN